jgi:hypothetical protein
MVDELARRRDFTAAEDLHNQAMGRQSLYGLSREGANIKRPIVKPPQTGNIPSA